MIYKVRKHHLTVLGTMGKRLANINVENVEENRLNYRNFMFQSEGMEKYIGGVMPWF